MPSTGSWLAQAKEVVSNGAPKPYATATSNEEFFEPWVYTDHIIEDLLEKNGLQFKDKYQVDTDGALMLRVLTDTLWNIDEHHEKINHRASADVSSIPSIFGSCRGFICNA